MCGGTTVMPAVHTKNLAATGISCGCLISRVGEDPADCPFFLWDLVHRPRQFIEGRVVDILERLFDAVVLEVILARSRIQAS